MRYAPIWMTIARHRTLPGKDQHLSIRVLVDKFQSKNQIRTKIAVEIIVLILSIAVFIVGNLNHGNCKLQQDNFSCTGKLPMQVAMYVFQCWMSDGAYCLERFEKDGSLRIKR